VNEISQIMCVTGPCFAEPPPWTVATRHEVAQVPKRIKRAVRDFLDGEIGKAAPLPQLDYWDQLEKMTTLPEHDPSAETVGELGHELGPQFIMERDRIHDVLRKGFPVATVKRPEGLSNVLPSPVAWFRWRRSYKIGMEPLYVLDLLGARYITRDHAHALQVLYPEVYQDVSTALILGIQEAAAKRKSWRLSHKGDVALQAFLQLSAMSPGLAKDLQGNYKIAAQRQAAASKAGKSQAADQASTPTQRATNL
jgi:hypothetical protein